MFQKLRVMFQRMVIKMTENQQQKQRDWMLTFSCEYWTKEEIEESLKSYSYIGQQEEGKGGFLHYQVFIQAKTPIYFSALQKKLKNAHIEPRKGSSQQCYDYVTKSETAIPGTTIQNGEMKLSNKGALKLTFEDLRDKIKEGAKVSDLIVSEPLRTPDIEALREYERALIKKKANTGFRNLNVNYLWGKTGTGKTRFLFETYGYDNMYRVSNYKNPFDNYEGERILVLDEFYESLPIGLMLNVLDGYPLQMPARYHAKWAVYDEVWILSNRRLAHQYEMVAAKDLEVYNAFHRRIDNSWAMENGKPELKVSSYGSQFIDEN